MTNTTNPSFSEVNAMSLEQLAARYDEQKDHSSYGVGIIDYRQEYYRRLQDKQTTAMLAYTKWVTFMTAIVTVATLVNLYVALKPPAATPAVIPPTRHALPTITKTIQVPKPPAKP